MSRFADFLETPQEDLDMMKRHRLALIRSSINQRFYPKRTLKTIQEASNTRTSSDVLGIILKLMALLAVATYIFGYGVALAYSEIFGVPQLTFFSSPLDLVGIAVDLIPFAIVEYFAKASAQLWAFPTSKIEMVTYFGMGVGVALTWCFFALTSRVAIRKRFPIQVLPSEKLLREERWRRVVPRAIGYGGFVTLLLFVARAFAVSLFLAGTTFVTSMALLGYFVARSYADLEIIRPETCTEILSREDWIKPRQTEPKQESSEKTSKRYAKCVKVILLAESKQPQQIIGRVVLGNSEYIVLYDGTFNKEKPRARRIPIKNAIVESADESDNPRRHANAPIDVEQHPVPAANGR